MNRIGSKLLFAGLVLIIGPFFGFTIRGTAQDFDLGSSIMVGIGSVVVGYLIISFAKKS